MHSERKDHHSSQPRGIPRDKILLFVGLILIGSAIGWLLFKTPDDPKAVTEVHEPTLVGTPLVNQDTPVVKPIQPNPSPQTQTPAPTPPDFTVAETEAVSPPKKPTFGKPTIADLGNGWKKYKGAWFEVDFPETLTPTPSLNPASGTESVFFQSEDKTMDFYAAVTKRREAPKDIRFDSTADSLLLKKERRQGDWIKCFARDRSHIRIYDENFGKKGNSVLGFRFYNWVIHGNNVQDYERFKNSFVHFGE